VATTGTDKKAAVSRKRFWDLIAAATALLALTIVAGGLLLTGSASDAAVTVARRASDPETRQPPASGEANAVGRDAGGVTDLMRAAARGNLNGIRSLVGDGADPNQADLIGTTALMYAAQAGHVSAMRLLLRHGARVDARDRTGKTALMRAAQGAFVHGGEWIPLPEAVLVLLEHHAAVNAQDNRGTTALMLAAEHLHPKVVAILLRHGADPLIRNNAGATAVSRPRVLQRALLRQRTLWWPSLRQRIVRVVRLLERSAASRQRQPAGTRRRGGARPAAR
jgi:ankyrin repeat protein